MWVEISQMSALLEKLILPTIQDQLYNKKVLMKYFNKDNKGLSFKNDKIYITARTSGHSWVWFTWATGWITVGKNSHAQMEVSAKYGYGSHIIWDSTIQAVKGNPASLVSVVQELGTSLEDEFQKSINRQLYGNWEWVLTLINWNGSSTATHTVDSTRHLRVWQTLLVWTKAEIESGAADSVTVSTINSDTSVTFTSAITTADNDRIVISWVYTGWAYQEIAWLKNLVSNNTVDSGSSFQWIARATNDWTNSIVDTTSAVLTEAMIIDTISKIQEFWNTDIIVTTPALRNKYASLLNADRRFSNTIDLKWWFKGLEVAVGEKPIAMVADFDCPAGEMYFLDTSVFSIAQLNPLEYLRSWSGWIMTDVYDTDWKRIPAFQTTMKFYWNLVATHARANARYTNKTTS